MKVGLILLAWTQAVMGEYDMLYSVDQGYHKLEAELTKLIMVGPVIQDLDLCVQHCEEHDWCIMAQLHEGHCAHVADRGTLGMEHYGQDYKQNFNWEIDSDGTTTLLNIDDKTYRAHVGYGMSGFERIDPRRVLSPNGNPKVIHPEPQAELKAYGTFTRTVYPRHKDYASRGNATEWFYGYPMVGLFKNTHGLRAAFHETIKCGSVGGNETTMDYGNFLENRYFDIVHDGKYLQCENQNDDNVRGCEWASSSGNSNATIKWSFGAFENEPGSAPYNAILQAHDRTTGAHVGFLDVSRCNTLPSHLRVLPDGEHNGNPPMHCGIGKWAHTDGKHLCWDSGDKCISTDAQLTSNAAAQVELVPLETVINPDKFKALKYGNGSFVQCFREGTDDDARNDSSTTFCRPSETMKQLVSVEWNFNSNNLGKYTVDNKDSDLPICIAVWERESRSARWVQVGSLGTSQEFGPSLLFLSPDMCNPLEKGNDSPVHYEYASLVEHVGENYGGLISVNNTVFDSASVPVFAEGVHPQVNTSDFFWVTDDSVCPADHYVERVFLQDQTNAILGCRAIQAPECTLGPTSEVRVNVTGGSFDYCPSGHVMVGYDATSDEISCAPLTVTSGSAPSGPEHPFVGTISTDKYSLNVDDTYAISTGTWKGTPIQAIQGAPGHKLNVYHYGERCYTRFGDATFIDNVNHDVVVNPGETEAARCRQENQYVTHVQCVSSDCRLGLNITCQSSDFCKIPSKGAVFRNHQCNPGEVAIGVGCEGPDDTGDPCPAYNLLCANVTQDATLRPSIPSSGGDTDAGPNITLLVGGIGTFTFVLLVITTLCICFGPDDPTPDSSDVTSNSIIVGAKVARDVEMRVAEKVRTKSRSHELVRRNVEVKYMF